MSPGYFSRPRITPYPPSTFETNFIFSIIIPRVISVALSLVVMLNLLGDMWPAEETATDLLPIFADHESFLHLYGKRRAIDRRKMGHANITGSSIEDCIERV
ncbi:hypothetical protein [Haloferula sp.]|uniref:hypothetical protein n=1 Tax=Haloferula sp. TaxID=2497595 RepID=UPI003C774827